MKTLTNEFYKGYICKRNKNCNMYSGFYSRATNLTVLMFTLTNAYSNV